jgi:hypothetical protein
VKITGRGLEREYAFNRSYSTGSGRTSKIKTKGLAEVGRMCFADLLSVGQRPVGSNEAHAKAAIDWIARAQDATPNGGVSSTYNVLFMRWGASYPETTGYIIPSMFDYFHTTGDDQYKQRGLRMADWEVSVQMESGAFQSGDLDVLPQKPAIFNTGQVLSGLTRAYIETKEHKYKEATERGASWLLECQDTDGAWRRNLSALTTNPVHVYNARTAWALLQAHRITLKEIYLAAAVKNIDWVLTQQQANGWFQNAAFNINEEPPLHTIAYTIEGILECGVYLGSGAYIDAARIMNQYLKSMQNLKSTNKGIRGGVKGSQPCWGGYMRFSYPSWAAKFFVDALLLENRLEIEA